jgi:membrane dipeptidase
MSDMHEASGEPRAPQGVSAEAMALHRESLVLDLHIDTLLWARMVGYGMGKRHRNRVPSSPFAWHLDLPRAADGGLDSAVMGLVINPREVRSELMLPLKLLAWVERQRGIDQTLATLDVLQSAAERHSDRLVFALSGGDVRRAHAEGKFAALTCLEGAHGIEGSLDHVRSAHARGLRMLGIVHFQANEAGYPMTVKEFDDRGLTPFGRELIAELDRLRIVVDLAHLNERGVNDALGVMTRPFVVSHTACRALYDRSRNLTDDQIRNIADAGGVIGIAAGRTFVGPGGVERLVDHIEHVIRVGGPGAAALGSDFDGLIVPIPGFADVSAFPRVTQELLGRGHPPEVIRQVLGENGLRVLTEVCG